MSIYKKQLTKKYRPLNKRDQELLYQSMINGSSSAREEIINRCLPLVINIAEKFHINNKHIDIEDMIQEGNLALVKAVDNWNFDKSCITTVATHYIKNSLIDMISDSKYNIKFPYSMSRSAAQDLRRLDNNSTIKIKEKRIQKLMSCKAQRVPIEFAEFITNNEQIENNKCIVDLYEFSREHLDDVEYMIFSRFIGVNGKRHKINDICKELNMTQQDVTCIIKHCKRKLCRIAKHA